MKTFLLLGLSVLSFSAFANPVKTIGVVRSQCLLFPKFLEIDKMVSGVHYKVDRDTMSGCDTFSDGNIEYDTCSDLIKTRFNYRYSEVIITDHYTADGKLFVTTKEKTSQEIVEYVYDTTEGEWNYLSITGYNPVDEAAKTLLKKQYEEAKTSLEAKIAKNIYESDNGACEDSYYQ